MSTGQFFAPAFCEFRFATFYRKNPPQKTAGYMGVIRFRVVFMIRNFITNSFPKSNLDPTESFISNDIHLRFELGDELENGTTERVDHCVNKAIKIFELLFNESDEIYILLKSFKYEGAKEFYEVTEGYLEAQFSNFDKIVKDEKFVSTSETDEFYDPETDISEVATITTHHIQKIFKV